MSKNKIVTNEEILAQLALLQQQITISEKNNKPHVVLNSVFPKGKALFFVFCLRIPNYCSGNIPEKSLAFFLKSRIMKPKW